MGDMAGQGIAPEVVAELPLSGISIASARVLDIAVFDLTLEGHTFIHPVYYKSNMY